MESRPLIHPHQLRIIQKRRYQDGLVACACWNKHTTYGFRQCGFLSISFSVLLLISLFLPYIVAMCKTAMPTFLPFISQSGGTPPMNGLFAISMTILGFLGFSMFPLLYKSIIHRNIHNLKKIRMANNLSLPFITMACLGCVIVAANPEGYTQVPSKFEWVVTVLLGHGFGAFMVVFGSVVYQFFVTWIWFSLPDVTKLSKYIKLAISIMHVLLFLIAVKPMPDFLIEEFGSNPFDIQLMKNTTYELPIVFTTSYKICAVCEWGVCFLGAVFVLLLFKDFQRISFRVVLRHKSCFSDTTEPSPSIKLKPLS